MDEVAEHRRKVKEFLAREPFGYQKLAFEELLLFSTALTHDSFCSEAMNYKVPQKLESNERLEFLGDAVVELIVCKHVYSNTDFNEGKMTDFKQDIVANKKISDRVCAYGIKMDDVLLVGHGHREDGGNDIEESMRADAFEALIGAIYLTKGLEESERIVKEVLFPH